MAKLIHLLLSVANLTSKMLISVALIKIKFFQHIYLQDQLPRNHPPGKDVLYAKETILLVIVQAY